MSEDDLAVARRQIELLQSGELRPRSMSAGSSSSARCSSSL